MPYESMRNENERRRVCDVDELYECSEFFDSENIRGKHKICR